MTEAPPAAPARRPLTWLILAGLFLLILAARWAVVETYSSQVPFWDQWLFEAPLLKAAAEGHIPWAALANPANEHRILWTRLLQLASFQANDRLWDAQVLLTLNALLAAAVPAAALLALGGDRARAPFWLLGALAAALWLAPIQWYNTLWGIQSIVYLLALFSLGGMTLLLRCRELRAGWWAGLVLLLAALFCMGSGLLAAAAVLGAWLLKFWYRGEKPAKPWTGLATIAVLILGASLQAGAGRVEGLYATNLGDFAGSLYKSLCFPWTLSWETGQGMPPGLLLWLPGPVFLALIAARRRSPDFESGTWVVLAAVLLWVYAQLFIMAYTRGDGGRPPSWRHYDVHVIGLLANAAALITLLRPFLAEMRLRAPAVTAFALWTALLAGGLFQLSELALKELDIRKRQHATQVTNLRAFLATNDAAAHLEGKPPFAIPWDDPRYLAAVLRDRTVRAMLPPVLRDPIPLVASPEKSVDGHFREGVLPPFLPPTPYREAWSTWDTPKAASGPAALDLGTLAREPAAPYLIIPFTGEYTENGRELLFSPMIHPRKPEKSWGEIVLPVPKERPIPLKFNFAYYGSDRFTTKPLDGWLAVMEPIEAGQLTIWTRAWRRGTTYLLMTGSFVLVLGALLTLPSIKKP